MSRTAHSRSPGRVSCRRPARARAVSWRRSSRKATKASTSTTRKTGRAPAPWWTRARPPCPESSDRRVRILRRNESPQLETLYCDAGWRPWIFLKATTDDGAVGWAEITDSHGSPHGLAGIVQDLAPSVVGRDPRAVERIVWDLFRATRQSPGSVIQKAIGGIENALLDLKGKALGVPVYELFGGPTRDEVDVYWSHCGTTRARAWEVTNTPKLASYEDVTALGREVGGRRFQAFKTNIVIPGDEPQVLMPGFHGDGLDRNPSAELEDALVQLLDAFREGTEGRAQPIVDLNFNLTAEGALRIARTLEDRKSVV